MWVASLCVTKGKPKKKGKEGFSFCSIDHACKVIAKTKHFAHGAKE
jgi:hypothetical protein